MRIVFTGGGTGGHVFPNVAVIRGIRDQGSGMSIFYIGGKNSVEEKIIRDEGIPFYGIHVGKFRRYWDLKNFIDVFKVPLGFFEAIRILRKIKPDLVFAKGGYVSAPVCLAAWVLRIPVWLHESDVSPGLATRLCARFAERIWLSFEESRKYFEGLAAARLVVGNPIRKELLHGSASKGYKLTGFSKKLPVVLIMGGSSGAQSLNKLVMEILPNLLKEAQVIHITGKNFQFPISNFQFRYRTFPFLGPDLAHIYAIADVVISRAGSGSIFELLALKKPMILIPLPRAASRGDQIENARVFEKHGWATVLNQEAFTQSIRKLIHEKSHYPRLSTFKNAATIIAKAIYDKKS